MMMVLKKEQTLNIIVKETLISESKFHLKTKVY